MAELLHASRQSNWQRHWLVYVEPATWPSLISSAMPPILATWAQQQWPAMVRRVLCDDHEGFIPLGVPLPPALGKQRISLRAPVSAIRSYAPPPLLSVARHTAPRAWWPTLELILRDFPEMRCVGSLAWQSLTGLDYLSENSDLDMLMTCHNTSHADAVAQRLAEIDGGGTPLLDGELLSPAGYAVQWREWHAGTDEVLVKCFTGTQLMARQAVFA